MGTIDSSAMLSRLESFACFKFEDNDEQFDIELLRKLANLFSNNYPIKELKTPYVYPIEANEIVWEWEPRGHLVSLDITMGSFDASWFDYNVIEDEIEEQELNLLNTDSWSFIINKLSKLYADEQQTIQN